MALPENWETVHLVGHLVTDDNVPASAYSVRVQSSQTRLQDAVSHRLIFPGADTVTPDEGDGYFCIPAVISDTDTDITPAGRSHRITLLRGSTAVQSWFVTIDHAAATDMRFDTSNRVVSSGGALTPAIWMTDLWQFTDAPTVTPVNPGGGSADLSDYFTKAQTTAQITSALSSHGAEADPHPQYALPAEVAEAVAAGAPDATTTVKGKQVLLGGTADAPTVPYGKVTGAPTALPPSGGAGGVLSGNYPNPAFAVDMATQAELDAVAAAKADSSALTGHTTRTDNPHATTKQQVGLGNVDNTADSAKPVSTAQQTAIDAAKARATHTGTQPATTITGLASVATTGAYTDLSGRPTIPAAYTDEQARDALGAALVGRRSATVIPDDAADQIVISTGERDLAGTSSPSTDLRLYGQILDVGTAGQFDAGYVESPCVFLDPATGRLAMVYTGYSGPGAAGTASVGLAYSDDGLTWTKAGQMFSGTGVDGDPDKGGATGPVVVVGDDGRYHLFYIGLTEAGYEAGTKSICRASATSLSGPWTRHGTIVSAGSGWRAGAVWHPNLVFAKGRWYLFFNAGTTVERCGYATADALTGPWTVDDVNSPVLPDTGHTADGIWGGDPFVWREGDHWRMDFANANASFTAVGDFWATTTDAEFPLGWKVRGQTTQFSQLHPFKPWIYRFNGRIFHYGTNGRIRVMVAPDLTMQSPLVTGRWRFKPPNGGADGTIGNIPSMVVGDDLVMWTGPNRSKLMIGNTSGNSELLVGQDSTHAILFAWNYAASAAGAAAALETYGGSNELQIQNNAGPVRLGGSSGRVGFFGANPSTRPTAQAAADSSTVDTTYGTEEAAVINNLRTRLGTLEAKLKTLGLLS